MRDPPVAGRTPPTPAAGAPAPGDACTDATHWPFTSVKPAGIEVWVPGTFGHRSIAEPAPATVVVVVVTAPSEPVGGAVVTVVGGTVVVGAAGIVV